MTSDIVPPALARHALPPAVAIEPSPLGGPVVRLRHGASQALVALHGATVLNWTVDNGTGLLWLSPVARIREGRGLRGGIPVCWPWFGDHASDPAKPAHGFVRQRAWTIARTAATGDGASVTLATVTTDADLQLFPYRAAVRLTVTLGGGLSLALETHNAGEMPLPLTQALHTYFRVADIADVAVTGLEGRAYLDKLEGFARKTQAGPITFAGETDRIYLGDTSPITLADSRAGRRIVITSTGSGSAVVWNPWEQKTRRLGDMGSPDAFRQMLCIETANAGDDIITLAPGAAHTLAAAYRIV